MEILIILLQIAVSLTFFVHKVKVYAGEKSGWLLGAVGAALAIPYFYLIGLYVYTALEVGLVILLGYMYIRKEKTSAIVVRWLRISTGSVMLVLTYSAFSGMITILELISSLGLLIGTWLFTANRDHSGWSLYVIAHMTAAYIGYAKEQTFFADLQVCSVIISVLAVYRYYSNRAPT